MDLMGRDVSEDGRAHSLALEASFVALQQLMMNGNTGRTRRRNCDVKVSIGDECALSEFQQRDFRCNSKKI